MSTEEKLKKARAKIRQLEKDVSERPTIWLESGPPHEITFSCDKCNRRITVTFTLRAITRK